MEVLKIKRVYEPPEKGDGVRVLVDRFWPRGLSKEKAKVDLWLREIAPSAELFRWYGHAPERWPEFLRRYRGELEQNPKAGGKILDLLKNGASPFFLPVLSQRRTTPSPSSFILRKL